MPIFNFKCPKCKKKKEELVTGDSKVICKCGEEMIKDYNDMSIGTAGFTI